MEETGEKLNHAPCIPVEAAKVETLVWVNCSSPQTPVTLTNTYTRR